MTLNIGLDSSLRMHFGFASFRPGQSEAIQNILDGQHTLVVMPTGSGKSLVFQLAAQYLSGITLVISPLIALMKDQVDSLQRRGISATFINSTLANREQKRRLEDLAAGKSRLVYIAPERLRSLQFREFLKKLEVSMLAIDEAHCISEWGHDFRPDYLYIAQFRAELGDPLTVALTATATPQVQNDIARLLGLMQTQRVVTGFNRPNLVLSVRYISNLTDRLKALQVLLPEQADGGTIVYTGTRREAEEVSEFARTVIGIETQHYHAGLTSEERTRIQDAFIAGDLSIVAATNAFGMGIDRPDVRQVIHYSLPGSLEAYYQEAGRAGRDGSPARAVLLYAPEDRALQEWFIENNVVSFQELHQLYDVLRSGKNGIVSITTADLSCKTSLPEVKVRVGLAELERAGALTHLDDDGLWMRITLHAWLESEIRDVIARNRERQAHRNAQLETMIAYAESNSCRRNIILNHFGDVGPSEAEVCCDNCQARQQVLPATDHSRALATLERAALIVLDTVRRLPSPVGIEKIAQILQGSKAKDILRFGYAKNTYYGKLAVFSQGALKHLVEQLLKMGYLKVVGGKYPVLKLTPLGEAAIRNKTAIPLNMKQQPTEPKITSGKVVRGKKPELQHIVALGESRSKSATPELVAYLESPDGNVRRLAASALGKIGDPSAVKPLLKLLEQEKKPQVRQYVVRALGRTAGREAIPALEIIEGNHYEKDYVRKAAVEALYRLHKVKRGGLVTGVRIQNPLNTTPDDPITTFLSRPHPRQLPGPWQAGWALDFHSQFAGADWNRSPTGALAYRLKYQGDLSVLPVLIEQATALASDHPELIQVDAVIPVPPSIERANDPVSCFARALAQRLGLTFLPVLVKSKPTAPQKEMHTLAQKQVNVAGAFELNKPVRGRCVLVVDDLFDSGATLKEIYRVLHRSGASAVNILTLTRTIHADA